MRSNLLVLWLISIVVSIGMWLERFVIVVTSLHRDFLPSSWGMYQPTMWDWAMFIGTIGFFFTLVVPVHSLPADDFDFRDAHDLAGSGSGGIDEGRSSVQ